MEKNKKASFSFVKEIHKVGQLLSLKEDDLLLLTMQVKSLFEKTLNRANSKGFESFLSLEAPLGDENSETAILGHLLADYENVMGLVAFFSEDYFYDEVNKEIWRAIESLRDSNQFVNVNTVNSQLSYEKKTDLIPPHHVRSLTIGITSNADDMVEAYVERLSGMYQKRAILFACEAAIGEVGALDYGGAEGFKNELIDRLLNIENVAADTAYANTKDIVKRQAAILQAAREREGDDDVIGIRSNLNDLDQLLLGFLPAKIYIVAGRPGMGKSALLLTMLWSMAMDGKKVALFSLEMGEKEIIPRLWAIENKRNSRAYKLGKITPEEEVRFFDKLYSSTFFIDDTAGLCLDDFVARATRLVKKEGVEIIGIDYLQLMHGYRHKNYRGNRELEISEISRVLKEVSKNLDIPIIPLAQLSRAVESRGGDKRPQLSDLRESGAIEQDADVVMFCYRPEYYNIVEDGDGASLLGLGELIISKHRDGALDNVKCHFHAASTKWSDYEEIEEDYFNESINNETNSFLSRIGQVSLEESLGRDNDLPF